MKRVVKLTESDLTRIVKRVMSEQLGFIEMLSRLPETGQDVVGLNTIGDPIIRDTTNFEKSVSNLFYWAKKNTGSSDVDYKSKIMKLYNAISGPGTNETDVKQVLSSLQNMNQLSTLVRNWKSVTKSTDSLYTWLIGDLDEGEIWSYIGSWKLKYTIHNSKKYKQVYT